MSGRTNVAGNGYGYPKYYGYAPYGYAPYNGYAPAYAAPYPYAPAVPNAPEAKQDK